ncbi:MAG: hypothetical protein Alpg2KO_14990 [Alphaproteobacteria bacterium]
MSTKPQLYIHIGQPRTATTTLQYFILNNVDKLEKDGLRYLQAGRSDFENHKELWMSILSALGGTVGKKYSDVKIPELSDTLNKIKMEITREECSKFLVSSEGFSSILRHQNRDDVISYVKNYLSEFCDVSIICYCRAPLSSLLSNYNQRCKTSAYVGPLIDFAFDAMRPVLNQKKLIDFYTEHFTRPRIIMRRYGDYSGHDLICDFLDILGIDATDYSKFPAENASLPIADAEASRIKHNMAGIGAHKIDRYIYGRPQPTPLEWQQFVDDLEAINADNKALFTEYFGEAPDPITLPDLIWAEREINHKVATKNLWRSIQSA